jgi:hypothetical protein
MKKLLRLQSKGLLTLSWVLFSWGSFSLPLLAHSHQKTTNKVYQTKIQFIPANHHPPDRGTPPANEGTGSRGGCIEMKHQPPLTSLVGSPNLKLTTQKHPHIWVYVPYTSQQADEGEFSLQDGDEELLRTRFKLQGTPGIVSISLPANIPPLQVGKEYRWYLDINCPNSAASGTLPTPASLTGLVQRVSVSSQIQQELNTAKTPLEKIGIYAKHGIWIEALTELAQLRLQEPNNSQLRITWIEFLSAENVGLARIAQEPIIGSITTSSLLK